MTPQLFPSIKHVMDKYRNKLPKDDLKKFAKDISKKLVASDYKNNRVQDPTKITEKQEKKIKQYVKDFFDKAVTKKVAYDKARKAKKAAAAAAKEAAVNGQKEVETTDDAKAEPEDDVVPDLADDDVEMSDAENDTAIAESVPATPGGSFDTPNDNDLKRKHEDMSYDSTPGDETYKKIKDEEGSPAEPSPPPPPPPPPTGDMPDFEEGDYVKHEERRLTAEELALQEQEEALMRENEEALIKENEEAMQEAEAAKMDVDMPIAGSIDEVDEKMNGVDEASATASTNGHAS